MTAEEFAAKAINERGYLITASRKSLANGETVPELWFCRAPLKHPFTVIGETTLADYRQQGALLFGDAERDAADQRYRFYRLTTD